MYPFDKKPEIDLVRAVEVAENLLKAVGAKNAYTVYSASLMGNGEPSAVWNLTFYDDEGERVEVKIHFPEDVCFVIVKNPDGSFVTTRYDRAGKLVKELFEDDKAGSKDHELDPFDTETAN